MKLFFLGQKVVILSSNPGIIKQEFTVDLPYQRERTGNKFISLREKVLAEIRSNGELKYSLDPLNMVSINRRELGLLCKLK